MPGQVFASYLSEARPQQVGSKLVTYWKYASNRLLRFRTLSPLKFSYSCNSSFTSSPSFSKR